MGNIILFTRNADAPVPLRASLAGIRSTIESRTGIPPLVALDQEGGIVVRLKHGLTPLPGAMAIAAAVAGGGASLADVEALAAVSGAELSSLGIDWNLAPVADVNVNRDNPVIGVRSFGEDPEAVADLASAYARGLQRSGVAATAKHFPGHGDTNVDSHLSLPRVDAGLPRLEAVELVPFKRLIADGVSSIMTAHVLFPAVEPEPIPATLSHRALTGLLRERLGFKGIIVTDCLEMKAVHGRYDNVAVRAVLAGADVLCVSHTASLQEAMFDSVKAAVLGGAIPESRIDESVARILAAKKAIAARKAALAPVPVALASPGSSSLVERIAAASISRIGSKPMPDLRLGGLYIDLRPEAQTGVEDSEYDQSTVSGALRAAGPAIETLAASLDPDEAAIASALAKIGAKPVVIGVYALSRHPAQARFVERIAAACDASGAPLAFVSMRDPYDAAFLAVLGGVDRAVICAYEYTSLSARAVARVMAGASVARGRCPVRAVGAA